MAVGVTGERTKFSDASPLLLCCTQGVMGGPCRYKSQCNDASSFRARRLTSK